MIIILQDMHQIKLLMLLIFQIHLTCKLFNIFHNKKEFYFIEKKIQKCILCKQKILNYSRAILIDMNYSSMKDFKDEIITLSKR